MSSKSLFILLMTCSLGLFSPLAMGEESTMQKEGLSFTDRDIDRYKKPSDNKTPVTTSTRRKEKEDNALRIREQQEQEYWCKKATLYKRKIENAQDEVEEWEKRLSELRDSDFQGSTKKKKIVEKNIKISQKKLERAKKQLEYTERDLSDLEEEAHRKEIPPGWLRCQFE